MTDAVKGWTALVGYVGTILAANWVIEEFGVVPVGFGLMAPAAVYLVGLAFTLRDVVQRCLGRRVVIVAIIMGALLSWFVSPRYAVASGVAFLVSETADYFVYTPLAERSWMGAVAVSNTVATVVDSLVFLWLAFHSLELFWGQVVGKMWITLVIVTILAALRAQRRIPAPD